MKSIYAVELPDTDPRAAKDDSVNRIALKTGNQSIHCALRPTNRLAALDTARGMAHTSDPLGYSLCDNSGSCGACPRVKAPKDQWIKWWNIRENMSGEVFLVGPDGFKGNNAWKFGSWGNLIASVDVPELEKRDDEIGTFWAFKP